MAAGLALRPDRKGKPLTSGSALQTNFFGYRRTGIEIPRL